MLRKDTNRFIHLLDKRVNDLIVNEETTILYELLKTDLEVSRATPLEYATMIHEIGHVDSSITVGARLGLIMVGKHCYQYSEDGWLYSIRRGRDIRNCVLAYIDDIDDEKSLTDSLIEMYNGGLAFTNAIKDIKPKNWYHWLRVSEHYRRNSVGISNRKCSDTRVVDKLTNNPHLAYEQNDYLRSCLEFYSEQFA